MTTNMPRSVLDGDELAADSQAEIIDLKAIALTMFNLVTAVVNRQRQRAALALLDDHLLRDIGVTQAQAMNEVKKPFYVK